MTNFIHIYAANGRCITSVPLGHRTLTHEIPASDHACAAFQLYPTGRSLKEWHAEERAGVVHLKDGDVQLVRIKSTDLVRDMRPAGVTQLKDALRREGVVIEPLTGLSAASYEEAVEILSKTVAAVG